MTIYSLPLNSQSLKTQTLPLSADFEPLELFEALHQNLPTHFLAHNRMLFESAATDDQRALKSMLITRAALRISALKSTVTVKALTPLGKQFLAQLKAIYSQEVLASESAKIQEALPSSQSHQQLKQSFGEATFNIPHDLTRYPRGVLTLLEPILVLKSENFAPFIGGLFGYDLVGDYYQIRIPEQGREEDLTLYLAEEMIRLDHESKRAVYQHLLLLNDSDKEIRSRYSLVKEVIDKLSSTLPTELSTGKRDAALLSFKRGGGEDSFPQSSSQGYPQKETLKSQSTTNIDRIKKEGDTCSRSDYSEIHPKSYIHSFPQSYPQKSNTIFPVSEEGKEKCAQKEVKERQNVDDAFCASHPIVNAEYGVFLPEASKFKAAVERYKERIHSGEFLQIVPSRRFTLPCSDPLASYRELKKSHPSPYLFYLEDEAFTLFGASPESALKYKPESNELELYPIAGTQPRGRRDGAIDPRLDAQYEAKLRSDKKEVAEHLMLVELAKEDLAPIALPESVEVKELMKVDRYSFVMHLVSRVVAKLDPTLTPLDAYLRVMNMGTLTGAPKVAAMREIYQFEEEARGSYGGAIGYIEGVFGAQDRFDSAIVIRSAFVKEGIARVQAGAGIVADSDPESECLETENKASSVISAILRSEGVLK